MYTQELRKTGEHLEYGEIVDLEEAYVRHVPVPWLILLPVLLFAAICRLPVVLVMMARGTKVSGGAARGLSELRRGPGIAVMPLWIRNWEGDIAEVEVHGYVCSGRLQLGDRVQVETVRQRRADLPPRAVRIQNLTSEQLIAPHPDTMLSHLGLALLLRAFLGLVLATAIVAAWASAQ